VRHRFSAPCHAFARPLRRRTDRCAPRGAQSVAFINPGKSDEVYWVTAARGMQAAAEDLGMKLEVRYSERDHTKAIDIARELASRPAASRPSSR
jgi:ABC-type sugar transport system substrate-binding protein